MKNIIKITTLSLVTAALMALPAVSFAQATATADSSSSTNATATVKKKGTLPFHGAIASLDATAGTFSVGQMNFTVTSKTKISTNGVPATLADFKVGDKVTGAYKKGADGSLTATTLRSGPAKKKAAASTQ